MRSHHERESSKEHNNRHALKRVSDSLSSIRRGSWETFKRTDIFHVFKNKCTSTVNYSTIILWIIIVLKKCVHKFGNKMNADDDGDIQHTGTIIRHYMIK